MGMGGSHEREDDRHRAHPSHGRNQGNWRHDRHWEDLGETSATSQGGS